MLSFFFGWNQGAFPILLLLIDVMYQSQIQNKVMSGYVDDCLLYIIQNSVFKHAIPLLIAEIKDNKAKLVRERCFYYLNEILIHWDLSEREVFSLNT